MSSTFTGNLVGQWDKARRKLDQVERNLVQAKKDLIEAGNIVGEVLSPDDACAGEEFCIWVRWNDRDRLIAVTRLQEEQHWNVQWRGQARAKDSGKRMLTG